MSEKRAEIENIYTRAIYVVSAKDSEIRFRINEKSKKIDALLQENDAETFAFMTAENPRSEILPEAENAARQQQLAKELRAGNFRFLEGYGAGDDWRREKSLFVFDISEKRATELGEKFWQNAIVCGAKNGAPRLVWCFEDN